jgi:hypothetical protein
MRDFVKNRVDLEEGGSCLWWTWLTLLGFTAKVDGFVCPCLVFFVTAPSFCRNSNISPSAHFILIHYLRHFRSSLPMRSMHRSRTSKCDSQGTAGGPKYPPVSRPIDETGRHRESGNLQNPMKTGQRMKHAHVLS